MPPSAWLPCVSMLSSKVVFWLQQECCTALGGRAGGGRHLLRRSHLRQDRVLGCASEQFWCTELQFSSFLGQRILTLSFIPPQ